MEEQRKDITIKEKNILSACKLATIECYFKSVQKIDLPKKMLKKDRKMWILCTYRSKIGIDMKNVKISIDKNNNTITCDLPNAVILGEPSICIDKKKKYKNMQQIVSQDGLFIKNPITVSDQSNANKRAKSKIKENISNKESLFECARERAKSMIENYVNKISEISGNIYNVEFNYI